MHYDKEIEADEDLLFDQKDLTTVDMSHYTNEMFSTEIKDYLINVHGMNDNQVAYEMEKHFPELFETTKAELNLLI